MGRWVALCLAAACMLPLTGLPAAAEEPSAAAQARMSAIPEHSIEQAVEVPLEPCWKQQRVPKYVDFETPIYEWRLVDMYILVPTTRTVDIVEEKCVPTGKQPKCGCGPVDSPQPSGAAIQRRKLATGPVGALERRKVPGVKQWAWVQVDKKVERRCVGYECKWVDLNFGKTRTEAKCVLLPAEVVTVVPDGGTKPEPLPGSRRVLTESEWRKAVDFAWSRPPR